MALCDATIGLGALLSPTSMEVIGYYVDIDQILLQQRQQQAQVAGEGTKASATYTFSNLKAQADITQQEANGLISNGSLSLGFQGFGYAKGEMLNGQINKAQTSANHAGEAIEILEKSHPAEVGLGRGGDIENAASPFSKYENEQGFKYGSKLTDIQKSELENPNSDLAKRNAIERAKQAKTNFEKTIESSNSEKARLTNMYQQVGQGLGALAQGITKSLEQSLYEVQAKYQAAKAGSDFLSSTAQGLMSTLDGLYSNTYSHISTLLEADGALFQADSMRA